MISSWRDAEGLEGLVDCVQQKASSRDNTPKNVSGGSRNYQDQEPSSKNPSIRSYMRVGVWRGFPREKNSGQKRGTVG